MKALIFDFDGTLVDSVYAHTLAWQQTLADFGIICPARQIHRRIGMSGTLVAKAIAREHGRDVDDDEINRIDKRRSKCFHLLKSSPLPRRDQFLPSSLIYEGTVSSIMGGSLIK